MHRRRGRTPPPSVAASAAAAAADDRDDSSSSTPSKARRGTTHHPRASALILLICGLCLCCALVVRLVLSLVLALGGASLVLPLLRDNGPRRHHPRVACVDIDATTRECPRSRRRRRGVVPWAMPWAKRKIEKAVDRPPPRPPRPYDIPDDYDWVDLIHKVETRQCTFADRTYQAVRVAPSTCNDVHSLAFQFGGPSPRRDSVLLDDDDEYRAVESTTSAMIDIDGDGGRGSVTSSSVTSRYLTHGGYRDVWAMRQHLGRAAARRHDDYDDYDYDDDPYDGMAVMKTNRMDEKGWSAKYLDAHRRDALISERAGGSPHDSSARHVVPLFHYCAFTTIVPYSTAGPLSAYVRGITRDTERPDVQTGIIDPIASYVLAMQAARGLYEAHLYRHGRATNAVADVKPSQFLLFDRRRDGGGGGVGVGGVGEGRRRRRRDDDGDDGHEQRAAAARAAKKTTTRRAVEDNVDVPIMQLQDFNRGRYLGRSRANGSTCPFRICGIEEFWNFRSPEEYSGLNSYSDDSCAGQDDKIDVWALGSVFYYLLSDGRMPFYYIDDDNHIDERKMKMILGGAISKLPDNYFPPPGKDVEVYSEEERKRIVRMRKERSRHPAYAALREVMMTCWVYKPEERPSSLQVVMMLEKKWDEMNVSSRV